MTKIVLWKTWNETAEFSLLPSSKGCALWGLAEPRPAGRKGNPENCSEQEVSGRDDPVRPGTKV